MAGSYEQACAEVGQRRSAALRGWGASFVGREDDVLAPMIGGVLRGMPAWPTREAWKVLKTPTTTIVTSMGLADPYEDDLGAGTPLMPGTRLEVWAETDDAIEPDASSWLFKLVSNVSYQVAAQTFDRALLDELGVLSMEVHARDLGAGRWPMGYVTDRGTVGVLLGLAHPTRAQTFAALGSDVRFCNVRVLNVLQLKQIVTGGEAGRNALAAELGAHPTGCVSSIKPLL